MKTVADMHGATMYRCEHCGWTAYCKRNVKNHEPACDKHRAKVELQQHKYVAEQYERVYTVEAACVCHPEGATE